MKNMDLDIRLSCIDKYMTDIFKHLIKQFEIGMENPIEISISLLTIKYKCIEPDTFLFSSHFDL